jgi:hypothetical protein
MMAIHYSSSLVMILAFAPQWNGWALTEAHMGLWPLAAIVVVLTYYFVVYRVILAPPTPGAIVPRY